MTTSTKTKLDKKLQDIESRIVDLTMPEILKYESKHLSILEGLNNFSSYAKIKEYQFIISDLSALLKENYDNKNIAELFIGITEKYLKILETKNSATFAVANFNHIIAACTMHYIQNLQSGDFEKYINRHRGVLTSGFLGVAETTVEYIENIGWGKDFDNENFAFNHDAPLYNKMMNIILENNYFTDIQEYFPDYNHDFGWQEVMKNLERINEDSTFWCRMEKISEQEQE